MPDRRVYKVQVMWRLKDKSVILTPYYVEATSMAAAVSTAHTYTYSDNVERELDGAPLRITVWPATVSATKNFYNR